MKHQGTPAAIEAAITAACPEWPDVLRRIRTHVPPYKREVYQYQAAALYALARQYNKAGVRILEIGTAYGFTAAALAEAAPRAMILTITPNPGNFEAATKHLAAYPNIGVKQITSCDLLKEYPLPADLSMIFVDGDHKNVVLDLPWYNLLVPGGLMLFHDYAPLESGRPCPPVYEALNDMAARLGRPFDVLVEDDARVGFPGFYRRAGEVWPPEV
jgi:predicted O-methyltransferase YrrM